MLRARTAIATAVFATVSVTFADELVQVKDGDVISAEVINSLISGLSDVQNGFNSVDDLDGIWSCTVYDTGAFGTNTCTSNGALVNSKTGDLTFDRTAKTWVWAGPGSLNDCGTGGAASGSYDVVAGQLLTDLGVYSTTRTSPTTFLWGLTNSFPPSGFNFCTKISTPPAPINNLAATSVSSVIQLTWTDQSDNEDGFRVERRPPVSNASWSTLQSLGANVVSFTDSTAATSETWQYRIFAFNSLGDSKTSSVIQHTLITSGG